MIPRLSDPTRAALWMMFFCASMASVSGLIRHLAGHIPPLEMAFFRNLFGFLTILPFALRIGVQNLKTHRLKMHGIRALFGASAMCFWFTGLTMIPISQATALNFTVPLFVTLGAVLVLGEVVRVHRWMALVVGFIGTLIIIRPGFQQVETGIFVVLISSVLISGALLSVKHLSRSEHPTTIVFYMGLLMTPLSLVPALFVWVEPAWSHYPWLIAMGVIASLGQMGLSRAMAAAPASVSMPFNFTHMLFASLIGILFFDEHPDLWTWIGALVIFSSTLYITHREARAKNRP